MNYAGSFLSDAEAMDFGRLAGGTRLASPRLPVRPSGDFERRVLALTLRQVSDLALLISASTSIVNRLEHDVTGEAPEAVLMAHLPGALNPDAELTHALIRSNLPIEVVAETQGFYTRLAAVRAMTASYCRFPAELAMKGGVHIETLACGWRELARQTQSLIGVLANLAVAFGAEAHEPAIAARYGRTLYLLGACAEGASPCVMADGTVEIPDILERRRHQRFSVDWLGSAYIGNRVADVRVVDISAGGLCMVVTGPHGGSAAAADLPDKGRVMVEIVGHGRLNGIVAWQAATSYGVMFDQSLEPGHALLVAARSTRRG